MPSDQYSRDFTDPNVRRPGRIDLELFQDIDACFDGHPGLQRAMKNWVKYWLHDGVMDQDLDLNSQNINNVNDLDVDGILGVDGVSNLNNDVNVTGTHDVVGDITVSGVVDTIDVASHVHDGTPGDGVTATGALIAWKQDYDATHTIPDIVYTATDASVTINLPEDCTVLMTWKTSLFSNDTATFLSSSIINDGGNLLETVQEFKSFDPGDAQISSGGSYVKNYTAGNYTWTFMMKREPGAAANAFATDIVLTIMAFKQIASS